MTRVAAFVGGVVFGLGLILSQMVNPAKILGFLDLSGPWDPTLAVVFLGALAVAVPGMRLVLRRGKPVFGERFALPARGAVDGPLIAGSVVFGIGWGLAGFCPGPAITALVSGEGRVILFVAAMVAGMAAYRIVDRWRTGATDG
jgi:hypothetical protein